MSQPRTILRPLCIMEGWFYTLRYWLRGGVLQFTVAGHAYVEGESYKGEREGAPALIEPLICERCGHVLEGWKPW